MLLFLKLNQNKIFYYLSILLLVAWSILATIKLMLTHDQVLLIKTDKYQTVVMDPKFQAKTPVEIENFINYFVGNFYSYSSLNFEAHIDEAITLMDKDEALRHAEKLTKMSENVVTNQIIQTAQVLKITSLKDFEYEIEMDVKRRDLNTESQDKFKIKFELKEIERSKQNPFGLKVVGIHETYQ